ncbi:hypothetical protein C8Q73DRAFT_205090 [Cubamyces lactineus]|nr:hypothetical protein C8Q73DRAFT_205090 [Cubamyces lactineus]
MNRQESLAERELEEVTRLLDQLTHVHHRNEANELAKNVFRGTRSALNFLNDLAQLHPIIDGVVKAVSVVIDLEFQRLQDDPCIAVVHTTMIKTVFHLRYLNRVSNVFEESPLKGAMEIMCNNIAHTVRKFGEFVDTYHIHWQRTVKFLFSYAYKKQLQHLGEEFERLRRDLDEMYRSTTQIQIAPAITNTTEILNSIHLIDPDMLQAQHVAEASGGVEAVLQSPTHIEEVAAQMGENVTHTMLSVLQGGFDGLLQKHAPRYHMKYKSVEARIVQSERRAVETNEGSHKAIEDEEFQQIWINYGWRITVKCSCFVEGLHEYYNARLHAQNHGSGISSDDAWTSQYLSRTMYYAAIGKIIDDDGSGYIAAQELNVFLKSGQRCLPEWRKPQWFAFWASGWHNNNAWYYDEISRMMQGVQDMSQGADLDARNPHWASTTLTLQSLQPLLLVMGNEDISGVDESRTPRQLLHLQQEFRQFEEKTISDKLHDFGFYLVDTESIVAVVSDTRIELHIMSLLYLLAKRIHELVSKVVTQQRNTAEDLCEIEAVATSCIAVFVALDHRLHELTYGWRLEAKDVSMQVDRYADGLFKRYYTKPWLFQKAYDNLRCNMFGDKHELPRNLRPITRTQLPVPAPADAVDTLAKRFQELQIHLNEHDAVLEKLESLSAPGPITAFARKLKGMFRPRAALKKKVAVESVVQSPSLLAPSPNGRRYLSLAYRWSQNLCSTSLRRVGHCLRRRAD